MAFLSLSKQTPDPHNKIIDDCHQIVAYARHRLPNSIPRCPRSKVTAVPILPLLIPRHVVLLTDINVCESKHIYPTNQVAICSYETTQWSSGRHGCSVSGKSRIKISAHKPANFKLIVFPSFSK